MSGHCCNNHIELDETNKPLMKIQRKALYLALGINILVFILELSAGIAAGSDAIIADTVHLFSHIFVIALSIIALKWDSKRKAMAAGFKAILVLMLGLSIFFDAIIALCDQNHLPEPLYMSFAAIVALVGNVVTLFVLARHRNQDLNMQSTWACSKTDLITNVSLIGASFLVSYLSRGWPDGVMGVVLGAFVVNISYQLLKKTYVELRLS